MIVYQDQIWLKSQCGKRETQILQQLRTVEHDRLKVRLVDSLVANPGVVYITDNVISTDHIALYPEFWGIYFYTPNYISRAPSRLFNCFINRICPNRQSWFYQFIRRGILAKGHVSYRVDVSRTEWEGFTDPILVNDIIFDRVNRIFQNEHEQIRTQIPYCNFDGDLDQSIVDSKISLVLETYFDNPNISFSEKTFRAVQLPRPFLIYSYPGSISILRKYGFDVWDDFVDHTYDTIMQERDREQAILDELIKFDGIEFSKNDLANFETRAAHNQNLLQEFGDRLPSKLKSIIDQLKQ